MNHAVLCEIPATQKPNQRGELVCVKCGAGYPADRVRHPCRFPCRRLDLTEYRKRKVCRCSERHAALNRVLPKLGDAVKLAADPLARWLGFNHRSMLLEYPHGLGDCVQLTIVLRHLRRWFRNWQFDCLVPPGTSSMLEAAGARRGFNAQGSRPVMTAYDLARYVTIGEPSSAFHDAPSTKSELILRHMFGRRSEPDLRGYYVEYSRADVRAARQYVDTLPATGFPKNLSHRKQSHRGCHWLLPSQCLTNPFRSSTGRQAARDTRSTKTLCRRFVLIHYQGHSAQRNKNLDEQVVRRVCEVVRQAGRVPVILDFGRPQRSTLIDQSTVFCPQAGHRLWRGHKTGDAARIAALASLADLCIGIDSGPGHIFGSTTLCTPTLIVWRRHHPVHYYQPAPHVVHLVPAAHARSAHGDAAVEFFSQQYHYKVAWRHLRVELPELVAAALSAEKVQIPRDANLPAFGAYDWSELLDAVERGPAAVPDLFIDCGVGPRPHSEAAQIVARFGCRCVGCEPRRGIHAERRKEFPGQLRRWGVWSQPGRRTIEARAATAGEAGLLPTVDRTPIVERERVRLVTLDDWLAGEAFKNALLWLDIEGAELEALRGAERLLRSGRIRYVVCEVSLSKRFENGPTPADVHAHLLERGFALVWQRRTGGVADRLYVRIPGERLLPQSCQDNY